MKTLIMIFMAMFMTTGTLYGYSPDQIPPVPSEEQPEVLTRGPVNEAFAKPVNLEEESDFTVPEAPPPDVNETPPEDRPVGDQFAWIPGYWAWDSERNEYIWVSGCWRAVPPGKYWVPGYWTEVEDGWRWVSGYWAPVGDKEIEYLPPPPAVTYVDPPSSVSPGRIWVPPCWYWNYGYYTLRSGYWIDAREDWLWVPSHYVWTPRGYAFVNGYWDYPLNCRGVLFAPVYFPGHIYRRGRLSFSLNVVINMGSLQFGLFTRPGYCHYYFGDYYDSFYIGIGIFPWFECVTRHTWYDPIYLHNRWHHRKHDPNWWHRERHEYARRKADRKLRPPRTYREMEHRVRNMDKSHKRNFEIAEPMKRHIENNTATFKFRKNTSKDRIPVSRYADNTHKYDGERSQRRSPDTVIRTNRQGLNNIASAEQREKRSPAVYQRPEAKQGARRENVNRKREDTREARAGGQKSSISSPYRQKPSNAPKREEIRNETDSTKVRTSHLVEKQESKLSRRGTPSRNSGNRGGGKKRTYRR